MNIMIINEIKTLIAEIDGSYFVESEIGDKLVSFYNSIADKISGKPETPVPVESAWNTSDPAEFAQLIKDSVAGAFNPIINATVNFFKGFGTSVEDYNKLLDAPGSGSAESVKHAIFDQRVLNYTKQAADQAQSYLESLKDSVSNLPEKFQQAVITDYQEKTQQLLNYRTIDQLITQAGEENKEVIINFFSKYMSNPVISKLLDLSNGDYRIFIGLVVGSGVALVGGFAGATYLAVKKLKNSKEMTDALTKAANEYNSASSPSAKSQARAKVIAIGSKALVLSKLK